MNRCFKSKCSEELWSVRARSCHLSIDLENVIKQQSGFGVTKESLQYDQLFVYVFIINFY